MLNVFRTVPVYNKDGAPYLNELAEPMNKLVCKFPFQWMGKNFDNKLGSYVWREGELGVEDWESFTVLTAFMVCTPLVQHVGRGGRPVTNKNGEAVYESNLIVVKELLESEDPVKYLGIYGLNSYMRSLLFLVLVC